MARLPAAPGAYGTAAEPGHRGVEVAEAELEPHQGVGQRGAAGVVQVKRELLRRERRQEQLRRCAGLQRRADADGVAEGHLVAAEREQPLGDVERDASGRRRPSYGQPHTVET